MITNNLTQIAFLNAEKHHVKRIFFAGGFLQKNPYIWFRLSFGINFWSKVERGKNMRRLLGDLFEECSFFFFFFFFLACRVL
jgi:hypothetical protein